jgi:hypothetical protein
MWSEKLGNMGEFYQKAMQVFCDMNVKIFQLSEEEIRELEIRELEISGTEPGDSPLETIAKSNTISRMVITYALLAKMVDKMAKY